ncbi:MAG TPA: hypothetical protein VLX68_10635 [Chitinivibrionales bacterium]|nr:hypothetical protein [Chitinivibrionales bacterium]
MQNQKAQVQNDSATLKKRTVFDRSPSYPGIDLKTALERARELYEKDRQNWANIEVVVGHWGYKNAKVGPAMVTIAAMKKFGILETQGLSDKKEARLTKDAIEFLIDNRAESPERDELIKKLALTPEIHSSLWKEYNGHLPSNENLKYNLRKKGFSETGADEFIKEFRSTIAHSGIDKSPESSYISGDDPAGQGEGIKDPPKPEGNQIPPKGDDLKPPAFIIPKKGGEMRTYPITFLDGSQGSFTIPFPMTKEDWDRMKKQLDFQLEMLEPVHVKTEPAPEMKKENNG